MSNHPPFLIRLEGESARQPDLEGDLHFGRRFSGRMAACHYRTRANGEPGWDSPAIGPFEDIPLSPAAMVLHYGQAIFEGFKAFKQSDGRVALFRPAAHLERLNRSAQRLCMPELPADLGLALTRRFVEVERDWIPDKPGASLYLRPTMIATEPALGVRASEEYLFFIIASPVGPYFPTGLAPVRIKVCDDQVRAVRGGLGAAKTPANYAASLQAARMAKADGYDQVLWLDGVERRWIEELGGMNFALVRDGVVLTPPLSDSILAGVTRDTLMRLAPRLGLSMRETPLDINEVMEGIASGSVSEAFACGTAAVVTPIGRIAHAGRELAVGGGVTGPVAARLHQALTDIHYGRAPDPDGWMDRLA